MSNDALPPDSLLQQTLHVATQLRASRSRLDAQALREYRARNNPEHITRALDEVYHCESSELDSDLRHWQTLSLAQRRKW